VGSSGCIYSCCISPVSSGPFHETGGGVFTSSWWPVSKGERLVLEGGAWVS